MEQLDIHIDCQMNAVSSEISLCKNRKKDPISEYNGDTMRSLGHGSGAVQCPISCPCLSIWIWIWIRVPVVNLAATPEKGEKASRNKKKLDPVTRDGSALTRIHGHLQAPPSPCHNLEIPMKSETSTSMTVSTSMTTSCMKSSDAKISVSCTSVSRVSSGSTRSDSLDSYTTASIKQQSDSCWKAIQTVNSKEPPLGLNHFKLLKFLGYGDIGCVYLVELNVASTYVAMKVMDKTSLVSRNKLSVHKLKREILGLLDHPFLPTLYSHFEIDQFYCLVMEFCSGGSLCSLWQKQPNKYFSEQAARDPKPENVLVPEEGHIMLSDFDLSLWCSINPTLVESSSPPSPILT